MHIHTYIPWLRTIYIYIYIYIYMYNYNTNIMVVHLPWSTGSIVWTPGSKTQKPCLFVTLRTQAHQNVLLSL